ncbi:hypothetical protein Patl_2747 [Paraglaciecola sp. T6c]|uniref:DUF2971 domain-containing protein n=1 Tax=Pseudoalteromonas atlantica (strain T6c / ATCC BAA-1087) TaxID=3042615 RepID=UPI00005C6734|nr:DUF2971 domain-containing protein [Paraglaciecola sp. T6c]ABG41258.1 hypothetical protein Patl_2747 [Paraglaciecola sp. T6c]
MLLYKFREFNANNLTALANKQLWFSNQSDFNDPFEGAHIKDNLVPQDILDVFVCQSKEEIGQKKYTEMLTEMGLKEGEFTNAQLFQKIAEHDLQILIDVIHNSKIVCLSLSEPGNDPIYNNLMWSHYADGLRGFCLVFDNDLLQQDIYSSSNKVMRPIKIQYQNTPNTLNLVDFIKSESVLGSEGSDNFVQAVTETIATKSTEWDYENELRIMSLDKSNFHHYASETLKEVVIGEKMPSTQRKLLIDTLKATYPDVIIKEAKLQTESYSLEIVTL